MTKDLEISRLDINDVREALYKKFNTPLLLFALYAMLVSYFYNLPVLSYSAIGENQFRLYDVAGAVIMYLYAKNYSLVNVFIKRHPIFNSAYVFLLYAGFTLPFTCMGSILAGKYIHIVQTLLYYFHFWSFFMTAVFLSILMKNPVLMRRFVLIALWSALIAFVVVILQNMDVLPFLWNERYRRDYHGFLSGTLGPNKIVIGMTAVMMLAMGIGLFTERRVKINKVLVLSMVVLALLVVVISGSRTSYVAALIFLIYYSIRETFSFAYFAAILFLVTAGIASFQPKIIDKAIAVYEHRVESKIQNEEDVKSARIDNLYEDLGAGRNRLLVWYVQMLSDEYYYIPLGRGFNNRLATYSSAHNMYLSLIYEVGLIGMILYFRWLVMYLFIRMPNFPKMRNALKGLVFATLVSLFFGEHLYIYRAIFALLGLFFFVVTILSAPIYLMNENRKP